MQQLKQLLGALALTIVFAAVVFGPGTGMAVGQEGKGNGANYSEWSTYTPAEGGFSVLFPGTPTTTQLTRGTGTEELIRHVVVFDTAQKRHFEVNFADLKGGSARAAELAQAGLSGFVDGLVEKGAELISRNKITPRGCPGEEATVRMLITAEQPGLIKARTFYVGERLYLLYYATSGFGAAELAIADRFLDSFAVTAGCAAQPKPGK